MCGSGCAFRHTLQKSVDNSLGDFSSSDEESDAKSPMGKPLYSLSHLIGPVLLIFEGLFAKT